METLPDTTASEETKPSIIVKLLITLLLAAVAVVAYLWQETKPVLLSEQTFTIESGMSVRDIAEKAKQENMVKSELWLYGILTTLYDPTKIHAGTYIFTPEDSVFVVAEKLASREAQDELLRFTLPEGITIQDMAAILDNQLPNFNKEEFLRLTNNLEGKLLPETYFVPTWYTTDDVITLLTSAHDTILTELQAQYSSTTITTNEVVILASILEREANSPESMAMVAGVLYNRLEAGMPLQTDATIEYSLDTQLNELPPGQLAEYLQTLDTPYNTYLTTGLPPTAIGNPGEDALRAAFNPTVSDYFYYITDMNGVFYYAETLAEHNTNVARYLK